MKNEKKTLNPDKNFENPYKKKGFINIFISFLLIFIMQISIVLVREGVLYKKNIISYENDLEFDYRLEVYYLMLNLKYTSAELENMILTPYGSFAEYRLLSGRDFSSESGVSEISLGELSHIADYFILLEKESSENIDLYILKGYKKGKIRKEYIIHEIYD